MSRARLLPTIRRRASPPRTKAAPFPQSELLLLAPATIELMTPNQPGKISNFLTVNQLKLADTWIVFGFVLDTP